MTPQTQSDIAPWLAERCAAGEAVYPVGGATALDYGFELSRAATRLDLSKLTRVIDFPARDMTVTVEAGMRITELQALLATEGQRLAVDVPQAAQATLGGALACNVSGPRRFGLGTLRDYVIGISAVDIRGREFKAGGRVVKNVAGYDLCKMLIGSVGTLAVITQVTLKLKPVPESRAALWLEYASLAQAEAALGALVSSAARPVSVDLLLPAAAATVVQAAGLDLPSGRPVLCLGVEGTSAECDWQMQALRQECAGAASQSEIAAVQAGNLLQTLTEYESRGGPLTLRANLRPSRTVAFLERLSSLGIPALAHAGNGIVLGPVPESVVRPVAAQQLLQPLRDAARSAGGNLVLPRCPGEWKPGLEVFGSAEASENVMRRLKSQLDPDDRLSPGRMFASGMNH